MTTMSANAQTVVVGLGRGVDSGRIARDYGVAIDGDETALRAVQVHGSDFSLARLARAVGVDERIRYVEPVVHFKPGHVRDDPATTLLDPNSGLPYEWAFGHIGVDRALNLTRGDPNILVGVVDSGWSQIRELSGKVARAWYYSTQATDSSDTEGHGTFVESIIAAPNDDGHGLAGFCGACRLDVFKDLGLTQFSTAGAIRRLVDDHVRIINLSRGAPTPMSFVMADAIHYAIQNGVLIVASSGNEGIGQVDTPASFLQPPNGALGYGLAVGASDRNDNRAAFSNWGTNLSLMAPGSFDAGCSFGIWAALPPTASDFDSGRGCNRNLTDGATGERYAYATGTSFSAPEVAGVAALVWAARPELKNYEVASILEQSATRPTGSGWQPDRGWGIVNAARALEMATGRSSQDTLVINDLHAEAPPRAHHFFNLNVSGAWQDNVPLASGTATCTAAVGRIRLASRTVNFQGGSASCSWRIPAKTAGKILNGRVLISDASGLQATRDFQFRVKR